MSHGMRAFCSALLVLAVIPTASRGQSSTATLDLGGNRVRYADTLELTAFTLSPAVSMRWPRATLAAVGNYSQFAEGAWTLQGLGALSLFTPSMGPFVAEVKGVGGGSSHRDGTSTSQLLGVARAHVGGRTAGGWIGGGGGGANDGIQWRVTRLGEVGGWLTMANAISALTATPTVVDDTVRYTDVELSVRWLLPRTELAVTGGTRSGRGLDAFGSSPNTWGSVNAVFWLAQRLGIVAGGGRYPLDLTQGYPGGTYASLGVRVGARPARIWDAPLADRAIETRARAAGITAFTASSVSGNRRVLRVHAPAAGSVEISGDFTLWQPVRLTQAAGGWWELRTDLRPGTYELTVRADGGAWLVPPGLTALRDEFGGTVGLLVVP